jgi:LuxR family maltose regulon positive regulatory protein
LEALAQMIDRRELVAALDRAARRKVTIVSAPAGSGKTSLLRAWASTRPHVAFMSVRPDQHDEQLFWLTLLGSVRDACWAVSDDQPPAPSFDADAAVARLLDELGDCPVTLVLDDLHELASADARKHLGTLLENLPPDAHAIVAARRDPALGLHKLRLAGELAEIRADQLRFTLDETRAFLADSGVRLCDDDVAKLYRRTEGWAAGLRLAALALAGNADPGRFVAEFSGSDRTVAEYLLAEMLDRQPADVRRMLLRTSLVGQVNGELADLLAGAPGSERILLDLEDANAFVTALDPQRTWFRYHNLFRGLLRLELRRTMPEEVPGLHATAARWLADHGQVADAIRQFQAAGDWAQAATMLCDHSLSLTLDGQAGTVRALLRSFPARFGAESAELAPVQAIADLDEMRLTEAAARIEAARARIAAVPAERQPRMRLQVAALDLLLARLLGRFDELSERSDQALTSPDTADLRALTLLNLGVTRAWSLRLAEAERLLLDGAALARDIGRPYLEVACLAYLGFAATAHSVAVAQRRCGEAIELAERHGWDDQPVIAPALATIAGTLTWTGDCREAEQWLDRALRATQGGAEPGLRLLLRMIEGMLAAARGRHREALEKFIAAGREQALMSGEHALTTRVISWTAATQARLGMLNEAWVTLTGQPDRREIRNARAVIHLHEGNPAAARRELAGRAPAGHAITLVEAHLIDALACQAQGDKHAVREAVEQALGLAEPDRLILPFAMTGAWELLESLPPDETSHAALITDILEQARGGEHAAPLLDELSPSELRLLRYLPTNMTRPEIASELTVSVNTVSTHIRKIYAKLGVTDRSEAVQRARELRLLGPRRG